MTSIALGQYHACALTASGQVYCWGGNYPYRQVGGTDASVLTPRLREDLSDITAITAQGSSTCAVTENHEVHCLGAQDTHA